MRTLFYTSPDYPPTRFMGSKQAILPDIWNAIKHLPFTTALDAFSGSGCVSYMFKGQGKAVISNDFLKYSYHMVNALIANADETLSESDIAMLLEPTLSEKTSFRRRFEASIFLMRTISFSITHMPISGDCPHPSNSRWPCLL